MKTHISATRNMFGKLSGSYSAQLRHNDATLVSDEGKTKDEALANLSHKIAAQDHYSHVRVYRWASNGALFTLYYAHGWAYDIVKPGNNEACSCFMSTRSQSEALATMERHVAQYGL